MRTKLADVNLFEQYNAHHTFASLLCPKKREEYMAKYADLQARVLKARAKQARAEARAMFRALNMVP